MNCDILIRDCSMLTPEYTFRKHQSIAILDSRIADIGPAAQMDGKYEAAETLSGAGRLVIPGLVDGHTHVSQQLLRGVISDQFPVIYLRFNLPYHSKLRAADEKLCAQLCCLEMIKSGITSFAEAGVVYLDQVVEAVAESGLRAALTRKVADKDDDIPPSMRYTTQEALSLSERLYRQYNGAGDGRIHIWFEIDTVASSTEALIRGMSELAQSYHTGVHAHLCEYPAAIFDTLNRFGMREAEYLDSLGALGPNLLAAHSILLSDREIRLLKERDVKIVHCPRSNLGKGFSRTPQMLGLGMSVGLGTDGTAHSGLSMFREITAFRHSQIANWGVPYLDYSVMPSRTLIDMATMGGARALQLERDVGSIEIGKKADLVLIDIDQPHILPTHNMLNTLTESVDAGDVRDVIVDGKVLMRDRVVQTLDEEKLMREAKRAITRISAQNGWDDSMLFGEY